MYVKKTILGLPTEESPNGPLYYSNFLLDILVIIIIK